MGTTIAASQATLQSGGTTTKHDIGGNTDGVVNTEKLAELIKDRQGETSIGAQPDGDSGKLAQQTPQDALDRRSDQPLPRDAGHYRGNLWCPAGRISESAARKDRT